MSRIRTVLHMVIGATTAAACWARVPPRSPEPGQSDPARITVAEPRLLDQGNGGGRVNGRARDALRAGWWWFTLAAALVWWAPALGLALGALVADRLRFRLAVGLGRALVGVGLSGMAEALFRHERVRAGRRVQSIRRQRL